MKIFGIQTILATRYLFGRKLRTLLTTLAVVIGVFVLFGMNIILPSFMAAFQANILAAYGQVDATLSHKTGEAFTQDALEKVRHLEGVRVASGTLSRNVNLPENFFDHDPAVRDRVNVLALVGLDPQMAGLVRNYSLAQGRFLRQGDGDAAVITASLAQELHLSLGDAIRLPTARGTAVFTVVGIRPPRTLSGNEEVLISLLRAQYYLDRPAQINIIEANFSTTDESKRKVIAANLQTELGESYRLGSLSSGTEIFASLKVGQFAMNFFGVMALVMGGFIIFNTFRTIVSERRRDIGMLRALGASRKTIIGTILAESLIQGGLGTLVGMASGWIFGIFLIKGISGMMESFIHLRLGAPVASPTLMITTILIGVGVTVLAGLIPAIRASRISPLEALRPESPAVQKKSARKSGAIGIIFLIIAISGFATGKFMFLGIGAVFFLLALIFLLPVLVDPLTHIFGKVLSWFFARGGTAVLAQSHLKRQPQRSAITASTTLIAMAIIVAMGGLVASVSGAFLGVIKKSLGSDYLFIPPSIGMWTANVGAHESLGNRLRSLDGVQEVTTLRFASSSSTSRKSFKGDHSGDTAISVIGIDPISFPKVSGLHFEAGKPAAAYGGLATGRNLIVNGPAASTFGLHPGDSLRLATAAGIKEYQVAGVANDYLNAKITTVYLSQENLKNDFGKTEDVFIQLNLKPKADPVSVEVAMKKLASDYPQFRMVSGKAYFDENKKIFYRTFASLYFLFAFLSIPAILALINTLAIGVIERTREIGMLRAVGATRKQVRRMIVTESLLLAGIGTAFGLLAGVYLGRMLISGMVVTGFSVPYLFPLSWLVVAVGIGLIIGWVASVFPARQAARLEIVDSLRFNG